MRLTNDHISFLKENEIFVFGSNLSGIHGGGAARLAKDKFGAIWGKGIGIMGSSYAIPTKSKNIERSLTVDEINPFVQDFIKYAKNNKDKIFLVTEIGCGLAGHKHADIAPLFKDAVEVENISLPGKFWEILNR